jgi:hypothetical protein
MGTFWQTNSVDSDAKASNRNHVDQDATQTQSAGSGSGLGIQVAGQEAKNHQGAVALSAALQDGASNENKPLRVLSPVATGTCTSRTASTATHRHRTATRSIRT